MVLKIFFNGTGLNMHSANVTDSRFSAARLLSIWRMERTHFWFAGRQALVESLIRQNLSRQSAILDVGCGTGWMVESLTRDGYRVAGMDLRSEGLPATGRKLPEVGLVQAEASHLPFDKNTFDAVLMLDILEHVDDKAALREVRSILRPGGTVIMTVPAFPCLWSYRDGAAGHLRRYTREGLRQLIVQSGFEVREISYYQFVLLPLVVMARLLGRKGPAIRDMEDQPHWLVNRALAWINRWEVALRPVVSWPCGSSMVAVFRKIEDVVDACLLAINAQDPGERSSTSDPAGSGPMKRPWRRSEKS
jgi:ubiquinone/menaquinone biosynthesis C-methylase UbiE